MADFCLEDLKRYLRRVRPAKGNWYWEAQVLMLVIMWQHDRRHQPRDDRGFRQGRLLIWRNPYWRL